MDDVEARAERRAELQRISLHKLKGIPFLRFDVDANDLIEARTMIAHGRAAGAAEQVKQPHARKTASNSAIASPDRTIAPVKRSPPHPSRLAAFHFRQSACMPAARL